MNSKKEVQHVYLVGAKSLGAYGGYETFVYKLTEYHQNKENIKYHVACKANGDGCMDESKFDGVTKINEHEFELHNIQVSKLKLLKANHTSQIYSLESDIARRYPREIAAAKGQIEALKNDMEAAKPLLAQDKDHFSMEISGKVYTERKEAGAAIIEACKALKAAGTEGRIGSYGAFELHEGTERLDGYDSIDSC